MARTGAQASGLCGASLGGLQLREAASPLDCEALLLAQPRASRPRISDPQKPPFQPQQRGTACNVRQ